MGSDGDCGEKGESTTTLEILSFRSYLAKAQVGLQQCSSSILDFR